MAKMESYMFTNLPIKAIRATLLYQDLDGERYEMNKPLQKMFSSRRFRWFQLTNEGTRRGQVMNRPRFEELDPQEPEDSFGASVSITVLIPNFIPSQGFEEMNSTSFSGNRLILSEMVRKRLVEETIWRTNILGI